LPTDLQRTIDDILQTQYHQTQSPFVRVVLRPHAKPAGKVLDFLIIRQNLPSFIAAMSSNEDQELSGTKKDSISKRPDFLHSALNNLGLNYVQKRLVGLLGVEIFDSKTSKITDRKRFNITVAGKSITVITNGGDFGLFEWFPTEIKVSKNDLSRNFRCHEP